MPQRGAALLGLWGESLEEGGRCSQRWEGQWPLTLLVEGRKSSVLRSPGDVNQRLGGRFTLAATNSPRPPPASTLRLHKSLRGR